MTRFLNFFAPCPRGLEALLADELRALGAVDPKAGSGGVAFRGDMQVCWNANLGSRLASRVLMQLAAVMGASLRGDAPMPLIVGGAGAGKSRALDDAERLAHEAGLVVGRAACRPHQAPTPGHDLRQLIGSLAIDVLRKMGT